MNKNETVKHYYITMTDKDGKFVAYVEVDAIHKEAARIVAERGYRHKAWATQIIL